jgi:hypothetical protein
MARKTSSQHDSRAKRYDLHFPVYFREVDSPTWLAGTTENISYSGVLFHCPASLALETTLELRLQVAVNSEGIGPAEIRSKGVVVRLEERNSPETPNALAVAMHDCRIVRPPAFNGGPVGNA